MTRDRTITDSDGNASSHFGSDLPDATANPVQPEPAFDATASLPSIEAAVASSDPQLGARSRRRSGRSPGQGREAVADRIDVAGSTSTGQDVAANKVSDRHERTPSAHDSNATTADGAGNEIVASAVADLEAGHVDGAQPNAGAIEGASGDADTGAAPRRSTDPGTSPPTPWATSPDPTTYPQANSSTQVHYRIHPATDPTPASPKPTGPSLDPDLDTESLTLEATGICALVAWVLEAQDTLARLRDATRVSPVLLEQLQALDIRFNSPVWGEGEGRAMAFMLRRQSALIEQLAARAE